MRMLIIESLTTARKPDPIEKIEVALRDHMRTKFHEVLDPSSHPDTYNAVHRLWGSIWPEDELGTPD